MSGGANDLFITNPRNFLKNNILIVNISNNANHGKFPVPQAGGNCGQTITVNISKSKDDRGQIGKSTTCPVYYVDEQVGAKNTYSHAFTAYYLPYHNNNFATMNLGTAADVFFTDSMNGCSFGRDNTGNPRVAHLNYTEKKVEGAAIDQTAIDNQFDRLFGPNGGQRFVRDQYKTGPGDYVTLVGVRANGQWTFMYQHRTQSGLGLTKMGRGWLMPPNMPKSL
jgi:hypothetical protein